MTGGESSAPDATSEPGRFWRMPARLLLTGTAGLCGLVLAVWIPASVAMPLMRDQGIFAWVGRTILAGGAPYRDAWDVKGPIVHLLYALAFILFGPCEGAIRVVHLLHLALFAWAAYRLLEGRPGRVAATVVASALAALATGGDPWNTSQPDEWAGIWLVTALALVWRPAWTGAAALAGALLGAAVVLKAPYALFAPVLLWAASGHRARTAMAAGAVVPMAAVGAWLWASGAGPAAFDVLARFDLDVARSATPFAPRAAQLGSPSLLAVLALGLVGVAAVWTEDARRGVLLGAMLVVAFCVALVQRKFYLYHFAPLSIVSAVGCGAALTVLAGHGPSRGARLRLVAAGLGCVAVCVWTLPEPWRRDWNYLSWRTGQRDTRRYRDEFEMLDVSRRSTEDIALRVRQATAPGEPMQLWGFDALLYVLADRPSASRLGFSYAVAAEPDPARRADRERELVADIERVRPRVLVVQETDDNQLMPGGSRAALRRLPALAAAIARCYAQAYRNRDYTMYTRTTTCGGAE